MEQHDIEKSIGLMDFIAVLRRCWIVLLAVVILVGAFSMGYAYITYEEQYTALSSFYVIRQSSPDNYGTGDYSIDLKMVNDVTKMLESPTVLSKIIATLNENEAFQGVITQQQLKSSITVQSDEDCRLICIYNVADTRENAEIISMTILDTVVANMEVIFKDDRVSKLDQGYASSLPSNSKFSTMDVLLPIICAMLVYAVYLVLYLTNDKIVTPEDVEHELGVSVLGSIPNMDTVDKYKSRYARYGRYGRYGRYSRYDHYATKPATPVSTPTESKKGE